MRITAIIQARMGSTRLPGKVLMTVKGRPLLSYQIGRLCLSKQIDEIVLATTTSSKDDGVAELAEKEHLKVYRGSEEDVLDRYYQAACECGAKHIMRLTADCPLIDPSVCDRAAELYEQEGADHVRTSERFAEGLDCEMFSFDVLKQAWERARLPSERQHVTQYLIKRPSEYKCCQLENDTDDSAYRFTVDEEEDFLVVKTVLESLHDGNDDSYTTRDVKAFLDGHPEIFTLNSHVIRNEGLLKSLEEDSGSARSGKER